MIDEPCDLLCMLGPLPVRLASSLQSQQRPSRIPHHTPIVSSPQGTGRAFFNSAPARRTDTLTPCPLRTPPSVKCESAS